jgi:ATP-dependent helicase/nuclease subunit A
MQEKTLTPAERGTAMHMVMQHVDISKPITRLAVEQLLQEMIRKELLTEEQQSAVDANQIITFFETELGKRMIRSQKVRREIPFSYACPAHVAYQDWCGNEESILIQGVIDCVFEDEQGLVLIDYKTDGIHDRFKGGFEQAKPVLEERYRIQIDLYSRALEQIFKKEVTDRYLFFFDGGHLLSLS